MNTTIDPCPTYENGFRTICTLSLQQTFPYLLTAVLIGVVILSLFFLLRGGVKWITSGGDKDGISAARNSIVATLTGLVVVFLSWFIVNIILQFFIGRSMSEALLFPDISLASVVEKRSR